jgi:conjugative relaxase-like TrwC/TraI family protein
VLTITKLRSAEYVLRSVADGMEDYFMGAGEAPGVWHGRWAPDLGLEGVVAADDLRALIEGVHPGTSEELLDGLRERKVTAIDVTLSVPKSVSLLWAFGSPETSSTVARAVVEATDRALDFLEERAAVTRRQEGGVRRRVGTDGFAIAAFAHRTSRDGDPQLHTHCLIPNLVRRDDGRHVAFDAAPLHTWAKASGTVFLNELERSLSHSLGVEWGPEKNGSREMVGFTTEQLRTFSKRTVAIQEHLDDIGAAFDTARERMVADDEASIDTRPAKDPTLTPERLRDRWHTEATAVGFQPGHGVDDLVVGRDVARPGPILDADVFAALADPATGLCASESRFGEAHVVERIAALSAGRLEIDEIVALTDRFLASGAVVRLTPDAAGRRPPQWSTVELRAVEDQLLADLDRLANIPGPVVPDTVITDAVRAVSVELSADQADAVRDLCGPGPAVRALVAPAGYGKTTTLRAAVDAQHATGRAVVVLAPTHKAVAELRSAGLEAQTIARFLVRLPDDPIQPNTTVIVDELSQLGTRPAASLLAAVAGTAGVQLWCVGDARQAQSVAAGGVAVEIERLAAAGAIVSATLTENRRQQDPTDRESLEHLRAGAVDECRAIRTTHGWDHEAGTNQDTRQALAEAAMRDGDRHGTDQVAVLAVSHLDSEDLADRIRTLRAARGELRGPTLTGPGWGPNQRSYAAGDRVLLHATIDPGPRPRVFNGATGTVLTVDQSGLRVRFDHGETATLPAALVAGRRADGTPNLSHGWARTVDGAQGGTWTQVHLLGTPALDRYTGYVGLSRGRHPTHTWNTRPDSDHPLHLLADQRTATDTITAALTRAEPKTLAATDDPWTLDRQLRTERDHHTTILATRPPDRSIALDRARTDLSQTEREHDQALRRLEACERRRRQLGPLHALRRGGRDDITRADDALSHAHLSIGQTQRRLEAAQAKVDVESAAIRARNAWNAEHGWRSARIAEIDDTLDHHWADVVLRTVRADDPLAFGIDALRHATNTHHADRGTITKSLPPDPHHELKTAKETRRHRQRELSKATRELANAESALDLARERRWGRRNKPAIEIAASDVGAAERHFDTARTLVQDAEDVLADVRRALEKWTEAMDTTAPERTRLDAAIEDLDAALDHTRPHRVRAAVTDPTSDLWTVLGPPPRTPGGLAAWCDLAEQLEAWNDRPPRADAWIDHLLGEPTHQVLGRRPGRDEWYRLAALLDSPGPNMATGELLSPRSTEMHREQESGRPVVQTAARSMVEGEVNSVNRADDFGLSL